MTLENEVQNVVLVSLELIRGGQRLDPENLHISNEFVIEQMPRLTNPELLAQILQHFRKRIAFLEDYSNPSPWI